MDENEEKVDKSVFSKLDAFVLFGAIIAIVLITVLYIFIIRNYSTYILPPDNNGNFLNFGTFGESFGGLNSIFSGLAFIGLVYTILMQSKELSLQRKELELTRIELKQTVEAQQHSVEQQRIQTELIKEQILKDIRPYINAYLDFRKPDICLVIKNIGKTAGYSFKMNCRNNFHTELGWELTSNINKFELQILPSGIEYVFPLFKVSFAEAIIKDCEILKIDYKFVFKSKEESFSINYNIKQFYSSANLEYNDSIVEILKEMNSSIKSLSSNKMK
jgi:hypothetical protein